MRAKPVAIGNMAGRADAIEGNQCVNCQRQMTATEINTWPMTYGAEYQQSGLCDTCQDSVFGERPLECTCAHPCCEADVGVGVITCGGQHCRIHGQSVPQGVPVGKVYGHE